MSLRRFSKLVSCMSSNFLLMGVICLVLVYYQGKDLLETCSSIYKLQKNGFHQAKSFLVTTQIRYLYLSDTFFNPVKTKKCAIFDLSSDILCSVFHENKIISLHHSIQPLTTQCYL